MAKTKGVVAAGHELTAKAAAEILEDGGNAFDACVAGLYMTFVAEAVFASPGGGGFLMARRAGSGKIALYDFFAQTPKQKRHERDIEFYPIQRSATKLKYLAGVETGTGTFLNDTQAEERAIALRASEPVS